MKTYIAGKQDEGRTILKYLTKVLSDVPISRLEKLFRKKDIKINSKRNIKKTYIVQEADEIVVYGVESNHSLSYIKATPTFEVIFEDENVLVVNKPIEVEVHGSPTSLDNQVLTYLKFEPTGSFMPSHVGRIDKVTSGIMLYGKTYDALRQLKESQDKFEKIYTFKSNLRQDITTEYKITHIEEKQRMAIHPQGKLTKTKFFQAGNMKLAQIFTGRKHQIRVSLSKLGFPIYGDTKYGGIKDSRVYLHAYTLILDGLTGDLVYLNDRKFVSKPSW